MSDDELAAAAVIAAYRLGGMDVADMTLKEIAPSAAMRMRILDIIWSDADTGTKRIATELWAISITRVMHGLAEEKRGRG